MGLARGRSAEVDAVSVERCCLLLEGGPVLYRSAYHGSIPRDGSPADRKLVIDWVLRATVPGRVLDGGLATGWR